MVISVLRWIAVLPAGVIAFILAYTVIFHLAGWNLGLLDRIPALLPVDAINVLQVLFPPAVAGFAGGAALIGSGAIVAPRFKTASAVVLVIANVVFLTGYVGLYLLSLSSDRPLAVVIVEYLGSLMGVGIGFAVVAKKYGW